MIADNRKGYSNTSGPIVIHGKVMQGLTGCDRYKRETGCFISAYDADTGKQLWKFNTVAREGEPGGDTWGKLPNLLRAGGDTWITGSYDPELNLTYWGVAQAKPWMRASRGTKSDDKALYTSSTLALQSGRPASSPGISSTSPASRSIWTKCSSACWSTSATRKLAVHHRQGRHPVEAGPQDRASFSTSKETVFQNVFDQIDPKTGEPTYRNDILEQQTGKWMQSCPSTEGGHNWQAMSYHPATERADHSAQPELHGDVRAQGRVQGRLGRHGGATGASSKCPAPTATSASWRPTT